ncbi:MAG: hypothetical protein IJ229_10955 [Clostridia bacterium]|nr:hypothetical protein [Clostridia bacterium]
MHCPTEAIRVRKGRAHILDERCIDCGECIRICDYHAKVAAIDTMADIHNIGDQVRETHLNQPDHGRAGGGNHGARQHGFVHLLRDRTGHDIRAAGDLEHLVKA